MFVSFSRGTKKSNIIWPASKKIPALILFSSEVVLRTLNECKRIGGSYNYAIFIEFAKLELDKSTYERWIIDFLLNFAFVAYWFFISFGFFYDY